MSDNLDTEVHYPVVVDAKKLAALIVTGKSYIRKPTKDRADHFNHVAKVLDAQAQASVDNG